MFKKFTTYEKWWLIILSALAVLMAIILPEEDCNGISGVVITLFYLADTLLGNLCEILMAKQNKWGVLLYNAVELIEIAVLIMIRARFASMAVAMFFWIPAHTMGFINWNKNQDREEKEKTVVRCLKPWHAVLLLVFCAIWTAVVGYLLVRYSPETDFFKSEKIEIAVAYMDACLSCLSIINGVLVYFRLKEAWTEWYLYTIIETIVNIISGQWILLVYKLGYLSNTCYGLITWSKYINKKNDQYEGKLKL